jgi:hypothetical protein
MTGLPRRDIEARLERALEDTATATMSLDRQPPPYPAVSPGMGARSAGGRRSRWVAPLLAAATVIAVVCGVIVISAVSAHKHRRPASPTGVLTPSPTPTRTSTAAPSGTPTSSPTARPSRSTPSSTGTGSAADPRRIDLANAVIDLPAWPASWSSLENDCPSGARQFHAGKSTVAGSRWASYLDGPPRYADLDGQSGDEALLTIRCQNGESNPPLLLALKPMPDGSLKTLGAINAQGPELLNYDPDTITIDGSTVLVEMMGPITGPGFLGADKQLRGYAYSAGRFRQVSGPTAFPPIPKTVRTADLRNTTFLLSAEACQALCTYVRFVDGTGRAALVPHGQLSTFSEGPSSFITDPQTGKDLAVIVISWRTAGDSTRTAAFGVSDSNGAKPLSGDAFVQTGGDIVGIESVSGSATGIATVVVRMSAGAQTRTYRASAYAGPWKRIS